MSKLDFSHAINTTPKNGAGFTLVELVVVMGIIATLSGILIFNFRAAATNKTARNQVVSIIISDIRRAQTMTTSSTLFNGVLTCGYGVHYISQTSYLIYAGSNAGGTCATANKNYQAGTDSVVQTISLFGDKFTIKAVFPDIFFEPPDPKTYIDGDSSLNGSPSVISVGVTGQACGGGACTNITIKTSGAIDVTNN